MLAVYEVCDWDDSNSEVGSAEVEMPCRRADSIPSTSAVKVNKFRKGQYEKTWVIHGWKRIAEKDRRSCDHPLLGVGARCLSTPQSLFHAAQARRNSHQTEGSRYRSPLSSVVKASTYPESSCGVRTHRNAGHLGVFRLRGDERGRVSP